MTNIWKECGRVGCSAETQNFGLINYLLHQIQITNAMRGNKMSSETIIPLPMPVSGSQLIICVWLIEKLGIFRKYIFVGILIHGKAPSEFFSELLPLKNAKHMPNDHVFNDMPPVSLLLRGTWQGIWGWYSHMRFQKIWFCRYWQHPSLVGGVWECNVWQSCYRPNAQWGSLAFFIWQEGGRDEKEQLHTDDIFSYSLECYCLCHDRGAVDVWKNGIKRKRGGRWLMMKSDLWWTWWWDG